MSEDIEKNKRIFYENSLLEIDSPEDN